MENAPENVKRPSEPPNKSRSNFISIPNIKEPRKRAEHKPEPLETKTPAKVDKAAAKKSVKLTNGHEDAKPIATTSATRAEDREAEVAISPDESKDEKVAGEKIEIEVDSEELKSRLSADEKEPISKPEASKTKKSPLSRSQSERAFSLPESEPCARFADTMRLSLAQKRVKTEPAQGSQTGTEHFRKMRPTSWSPPPGKSRSLLKARKAAKSEEVAPKVTLVNSSGLAALPEERNVCKIAVNPFPQKTSIIINGEEQRSRPENKITISVGGESATWRPTVIAVNSEASGSVHSEHNRTLVVLNDDYRPKVVVVEAQDKSRGSQKQKGLARWAGLPKEVLISKLLEDSLRKARESGEILDESSEKAIMSILKQGLLKSKDYGVSKSLDDENPYEVIKEPIYEEIPDKPPPLPTSPPPMDDLAKEREFFEKGIVDSYMSRNVFEGYKAPKVRDKFFNKDGDDGILAKFEILDYLINADEHMGPFEEGLKVEDDDEEDAERALEALYEQKETSLGDLSSKSSQISNVSDSSEECNIILTNSPETLKVGCWGICKGFEWNCRLSRHT